MKEMKPLLRLYSMYTSYIFYVFECETNKMLIIIVITIIINQFHQDFNQIDNLTKRSFSLINVNLSKGF